jgi:peptidoglycan hydrolase-like protein with peptidoglycan-binding domain
MYWLSLIYPRAERVTTNNDYTSIPLRSGAAVSPQISSTVSPQISPSVSSQISPTGRDRGEPSSSRSSGPVDSSADREMALDLLRIGDATRVQKRLADLGFFGGPPNGIWTPRSRQALREFKATNGLPRDDFWDEQTKTRLFDFNAEKMSSLRSGTKEPNTEPDEDSYYPPPPGTTLNPLNSADAVNLQKRLGELGFFVGKSDGVWGPASRNALHDFKVMSGLTADDQWDAITERTLTAEQPVRASETFVGGWAEEVVDCKPPHAGGAPLRISVRQAEKSGTVCKFGPALREGSAWRLQSVCKEGEKTWNANIRLSVSGDRLTWSSERGTDSFVRCRGR